MICFVVWFFLLNMVDVVSVVFFVLSKCCEIERKVKKLKVRKKKKVLKKLVVEINLRKD